MTGAITFCNLVLVTLTLNQHDIEETGTIETPRVDRPPNLCATTLPWWLERG